MSRLKLCNCRRERTLRFVIVKVGTAEEAERHENHQHLHHVREKDRERISHKLKICVRVNCN